MKKDDILKAGLAEFSQHSYAQASINEIIKKSNTSKGTFYHYFDSKEALYLALIQEVVDKKMQFLTDEIQQSEATTKNPSVFGVLRMQIQSSMQFAMHYPDYARFSTRIANEQDEAIKEKAQSIIGKKAGEYFDQLIAADIDQKRLRDDMPRDFVRQIILFMLTHFNDFVIKSGKEISVANADAIQETLHLYIDFIENGLGCR